MRRGDLWWADLGAHRPQEQTGRRPVIIWQSDALNRVLQSVLVVPLTTNLDRARLAGTAIGKEHFAVDGCKLPSNASKQWSGTHKELEDTVFLRPR